MPSMLLKNTLNIKINSDLNSLLSYDLIVKHVETTNVSANPKLSLLAPNH